MSAEPSQEPTAGPSRAAGRRRRGGRGRGRTGVTPTTERPAAGADPVGPPGADPAPPATDPAPPGAERRAERRARPSRGTRDGGRGPSRSRSDADGAQHAQERHRTQDTNRDTNRDTARRERRTAARRAVVVPAITYPEELPVSARREEIAAAIRDHQVVVVSGETGSGKTTQLPKIMLELGRGRDGQIGHTQPRRIAARSVAERINAELHGLDNPGAPALGAPGSVVGYQVRFTDASSEETLVKVMTDGILLAQIQRDPMLLAYDTLIIDEAHERSLNIDFLLGYLTRLLPQRPDLKLVITSATIDSERFARHFAGPPTAEHPDGVPAPVVEVTGRTYPVEIRYRPLSPDADLPTASTDDDDVAPDGGPLRRPPKAARTTKASTPTKGSRAPAPAEDRDLMTAICEAVDELGAEGPGDVLVFLSGEREIRDAEEALRGHLGARVVGAGPLTPRSVELLPLYSRLSAAEQHRVFEPHSTRRVVLSTNVAETSLTVPGVRYVVDPGTARISRFSKTTKVQRLPIEPISQASANQRSGRCGRVAEGVAIRLYSEDDFASRPEFTEPEILRTSLASVILQMVAVGVAGSPDDVARFPFVDPPDTRAIRDGVALLTELGALELVDGATRLTDTGRALALLPMDPRLARMIVEAGRRDVAREVMIIAAALSIQDPRERPAEERAQADQAHARFADPTSDLLSYLNLWNYVRDRQRELSGSAFRRLCRAEHLNYLRLREWQDVVTQLKEMAKPLGITVRPPARVGVATTSAEGSDGATDANHRLAWDADRIHQSVLAGLLSHIGMQQVTEVRAGAKDGGKDRGARRPQARNEYLGARGARFAIFPGSGLAKRPPAWVMAGELVETSRLWARDVARIQPEWAEELAPHLVRRSYSEPAWSTKQGAAMANERVLLYGVPIVAQRRVLYAKVDPGHARELFIRHALVEGEWTTHHEFFHTNRRLLEEAAEVEHRARRRGLVVDDDVLFDFYDERLPDDVVSARHFDTWWKGARRREPDLLTFPRQMLLAEDPGVDADAFPATWPQGELELGITYQFEPGTEADGVTVHVPLPVLARVRPEGFDWLVPGMLEELVTGLIRSLPKPVRVQLVPAPDVAREVTAWIREHVPSWADVVRAADMAPSVREAFADAVRALRDVEVPDDAWDAERLPAHLRVTFQVHEDRGARRAGRGDAPDPRAGTVVVDSGPDLVALQRRLAARSQDAVRSAVRDAVRAAVREAGREAGQGAGRAGEAPLPAPAAPVPGAGAAPPAPPPTGGLAEVADLRSWPADLAVLPEVVRTTAAGHVVEGYPALVAEGAAAPRVALRVLADRAVASGRHPAGVRDLLLAELALPTGRITSRWSTQQSLTLAASPYRTTDALVTDLQRAAVDALLAERTPDGGHTAPGTPSAAAAVRDASTYARWRAVVRDALEDRTYRVALDVVAVLAAARELDGQVRGSTSMALLAAVADVRAQLDALVGDGFVATTGAARLPHLVRYLRAAQHRLRKAAEDPRRDEGLAWQVRELADEHRAAVDAAARAPADPVRDAGLADVRWLLEELRVSLFAQQLGTPQPVSAKRIRTALAAASAPRPRG